MKYWYHMKYPNPTGRFCSLLNIISWFNRQHVTMFFAAVRNIKHMITRLQDVYSPQNITRRSEQKYYSFHKLVKSLLSHKEQHNGNVFISKCSRLFPQSPLTTGKYITIGSEGHTEQQLLTLLPTFTESQPSCQRLLPPPNTSQM